MVIHKINGVKYVPKLVSDYDEIELHLGMDQNLILKRQLMVKYLIKKKYQTHKTLPLPSIVKFTNLENNNTIFLRVNDRGPFVNDRIDFSKKAAIKFGFYEKGIAQVRVQLIDSGPHLLDEKYLNYLFLVNYAKNIDTNKIKEFSKNSKLLQIGVFEEKCFKFIDLS